MADVLVTGGAGYVGAHAAKALAEAGHRPVVFDNFATGWRAAVRFGPLIEGDIADAEALDRAFTAHDIGAVMHFAALSNVGISVREPETYWRNNVCGSLSLLEAMRRHGVTRIVFSSTAAIYGEPAGEMLAETDAQAPINPYGQTKLAVERLLADVEGAHGIRSVIFRYFNAAGADPAGEIGEHHIPETHLIPLVLDAISGRRDKITVFGTDYGTPDGTCIRDYIHVSDLAAAHVLGLEHLLGGGDSLALNLGAGAGHSVRSVIDTAAQVTGLKVPSENGARRPGDPARLVSSSALAESRLGWRCERSDLPTMIADAWAWHQRGGYSQ